MELCICRIIEWCIKYTISLIRLNNLWNKKIYFDLKKSKQTILHLAILYQYTNYGVESLQKILSITSIIAHHKFSVNEKRLTYQQQCALQVFHTRVNMRCKNYTRFSIGFSMNYLCCWTTMEKFNIAHRLKSNIIFCN